MDNLADIEPQAKEIQRSPKASSTQARSSNLKGLQTLRRTTHKLTASPFWKSWDSESLVRWHQLGTENLKIPCDSAQVLVHIE